MRKERAPGQRSITLGENTALTIKVGNKFEVAGSVKVPLRDRTRAKLSWENRALL